jgi:hypothetical protein
MKNMKGSFGGGKSVQGLFSAAAGKKALAPASENSATIQVFGSIDQPNKLMACPRCGKVLQEKQYPTHTVKCHKAFRVSYSEMATNMWAVIEDESKTPPANTRQLMQPPPQQHSQSPLQQSPIVTTDTSWELADSANTSKFFV